MKNIFTKGIVLSMLVTLLITNQGFASDGGDSENNKDIPEQSGDIASHEQRFLPQNTVKPTQDATLNQDIQKIRETIINKARQEFENEKKIILENVKNNILNRREGRAQIQQERLRVLSEAKEQIKTQIEQKKLENKNRVKLLIQTKLEEKLTRIRQLPKKQRDKIYDKLLQTIDTKLQNSSVSQKNSILLKMIKEILLESKNVKN